MTRSHRGRKKGSGSSPHGGDGRPESAAAAELEQNDDANVPKDVRHNRSRGQSGNEDPKKEFSTHSEAAGTKKSSNTKSKRHTAQPRSSQKSKHVAASSAAVPSMSSRISIDNDEDPGVIRLIREIKDVIETYEWDEWDEVKNIVQTLFRSSPYWSESSIRGIQYRTATRLSMKLSKVGLVKMDGRAVHDILISFYEKVMKAERKTVKAKDEPLIEPRFRMVNTDRVDHRGLPIYSQEKVARKDLFNSPSQPSPLSPELMDNARDLQHHKNQEDQSKIPSIRGQLQESGDPDNGPDSSESSSSDDEERGKSRKEKGWKGRKDKSSKKDNGSDKDKRGPSFNEQSHGPNDDRIGIGSTLKLASGFLAKLENKWSGPRDRYFTADEYARHYSHIMDMCEASTKVRMMFLPFAFRDDALDEYNANFRDEVRQGKYRNASAVIREISQRLETPEFKMFNMNQWVTLRMSDVRKTGDSTQMTFARLKRRVRRLQKTLGAVYKSDISLCDFYRRSLQNEQFWAYVDDSDPQLSSEVLQTKIELAIEKHSRLVKGSRGSKPIEIMASSVEDRRWGKPDKKRFNKTNPSDKNGNVMTCTGCGSKYHFYKECTNPNKQEYRTKRLEEIGRMKNSNQKRELHSYFTQLQEEDSDSTSDPEDVQDIKDEKDSSSDDDFRKIANGLHGQLDETMFLEMENIIDEEKSFFVECMNMHTRHVFFGTTLRKIQNEPKRAVSVNKSRQISLRYAEDDFPGIMIDNGSTGSLCSIAQLKAYRRFTGCPTPMRKLKNHFVVSAHGGSKCIGIATFKFPYGDTILSFNAPIVENSDTPLILGLNDQDKLLSSGADQKENSISFLNGPKIPLVREKGHMWLRWNYEEECLYTEKELTKLHYRFGHPGVKRMHDFLKRVKPDDLDENTRGMLESIQARCKECQYLAPKPYVVKVAVPHEDFIFNSEVVVDIMYIQGKSVLHVVDRATHFQAARFLQDDSTESIWRTFMQMWVLVYLGAPDNLRHDQGTQFVSPRFQKMAAEAGITCRPVGIEAPNAMGVGERYHAPLRKTFMKLQESYGMKPLDEMVEELPRGPGRPRKNARKITRPVGVKDEYLLDISIMCINSTVGPEGICPILLVFGAMPKLPLPSTLPSAVPQAERMMMMEKAREEYMKIVGSMRLKQAEKAFIPTTPPTTLTYGDKVLVYRETTGRWEPRNFVSRNENTILVYEPDGSTQPYPLPRVSMLQEGVYLPRPDLYGLDVDIENREDEHLQNDNVRNLQRNVEQPISLEVRDFIEPDTQEQTQTDIDTRELHRSRSEKDGFTDESLDIPDTTLRNIQSDETFVTKVLDKNDERRKLFGDAIKEEVDGLFAKGVFLETSRKNFTPEQLKSMTIMKSKLVLAFKEPGTREEKKKARLVVQAIGSKDKDKNMLITYSPTVSRASVRLMLAIAMRKNLEIFLRDISQAYVSASGKLLRDVYVVPPTELQTDEDILWKVERPLYGLPESGMLWFETYIGHHHNILNMESTETDPCLLFRRNEDGDLEGIICLQVDDSIGGGTVAFLKDENENSKVFRTREQKLLAEQSEMRFNGQYIRREGRMVYLHQRPYVERMPLQNIERSAASFMSHRGQAAYVSTCTRPDVTCAVNQLTQVVPDSADEHDFKRLDTVFKRMHDKNVELKYGNVSLENSKVHVYADASFATNKDLTSQLGYVILLVDDDHNCSVLTWSSVKCRRVTRSVLAAELYAVAHAFDAAFALAHTVGILLGRKVFVNVYTDSRTLFDSIINLCSMTEKRLLIDIACLREAYRNGDISQLCWIRSQYNLADAMTKDKKDSALLDALKTHRVNTPVEQWIAEGAIPQRKV